MREEGCKQLIKNVWQGRLRNGTFEDVMSKTEECSLELSYWNKHTFGMVHKQLELDKKELAKAQDIDPTFSKLEKHAKAWDEV